MKSKTLNRKRKQEALHELPTIPDKRYFSIGEVAYLCDVKPHVLRYWEQEFPQLDPIKRRGNRRYYQYKDVLLARQIKKLLYELGFTIDGARMQLSIDTMDVGKAVQNDAELKKIIAELEGILQKLRSPELQ